MISLDILPPCVIKYILTFVDTITTIKFSMTCNKYYISFYPSIGIIRDLFSKIIRIKKIKYIKALNRSEIEGIGLYFRCEICELVINDFDVNNKCMFCKNVCCNKCIVYPCCIECYECSNCKIVTTSKNNVCNLCKSSYCNNCLNNTIVCKNRYENHFVCNKCVDLSYYCNKCLTKKCPECVTTYGTMCYTCIRFKKNDYL